MGRTLDRAGPRRRRAAVLAAGLAAGSALLAHDPVRAVDLHPSFGGGDSLVTSWGIEDGLPQSTVNDLVETPDGELWLATFGGLVRFDGLRFETFDLATLDGLPSNRITALVPDADRGLWLATQTGHIVRFVDRRVTEVVPPSDRGTELVALAASPSGELFARDAGGRVLRIGSRGFETLLEAPSDVTFNNLLASPDGGVWVGQEKVLHRVDTGDRFDLPAVLTTAVPDGEGGLWLGLVDGLGRFAHGVARRVEVSPPLAESVTVILPEGNDRLWVGSRRGPVELARQPDGSWRQLRRPFELQRSRGIRSMLRDAAGNLWIGSNGEGLFRVARRPFSTVQLETGASQVSALAPDGAGGAWIAFGCRGLFRAPAGGALVPVALHHGKDPGAGCEHSLALGADGALWVRSRRELFRVRSRGRGAATTVERIAVELPDQQGALVADRDGALWIASREGWLQRLSPAGELTLMADLEAEIDSMALDATGAFWLGGRGAIFRWGDGRIERFGEERNVPPGAVRALLPGVGGGLLFGTYGGGLGWIREGRVARFSTRNGLLDNSVSGLLQDSRQRIWILANQAISVVALDELETVAAGWRDRLEPVHFGPERGVPEGNFGSPAAFAGESGRLWFGTIAGVLAIDPAEFPRDLTPPRVVIERVELDGRPVVVKPRIEIPAGTARVRFAFAAVAHSAPSRVRFRHRVQGVDRMWQEIGTQRSSSFTPAKPGDYFFQVEARNEDGVWSARPAVVALTVLPAWWQRSGVRIAGLVLGAGLLVGAHRLRLRAVQRRNRALIQEIEERRRAEEEAARLRRELEHVTRLATAGELATSLAHEVNQPLAAIVSNAQAGRRFLAGGESGRAEVDEILGDIARQGRRASEVIQRLREFLRKPAPRRAPLDLDDLLRGVLPLVRREIEDRRIELALDLAPALPKIRGDRVQLQQVAINLIQNACEAMQASPAPRRITIASRACEGAVEFSVADTGPGIAPELAATIFEPFVSSKVSGMGVGLSICRSLVESHGGALEAEAGAKGGARFRVVLPIEAAA